MERVVSSNWFRLLDLILVVVSGVIWYLQPGLGIWMLLIALLPWMLRLAAGRFPFSRTTFDLPLLIFLLTALIGVWASYNPSAARAKFWILISALLIYYALAGQSRDNLSYATGLISLVGLAIAVSFLLEHDWQDQGADLGVINRLGLLWLSIKPDVTAPSFQPNTAGGLLAVLFPFPFAILIRSWQKHRNFYPSFSYRNLIKLVIVSLTVGVMGFALVMSSSRGAWAALLIGMGLWFLWELSGYVTHSMISIRVNQPRVMVFVLGLIFVVVLLVFLLLAYPGGLSALAGDLPGNPSGESRLELLKSTYQLIREYPFTGGGLAAFSGLYSYYIMDIPHFLFSYSHNFYLDVLLEQGPLGAIVLGMVLLGSLWLLGRQSLLQSDDGQSKLLIGATSIALITFLFHGLIDDPMYGTLGTPLLFFPVGMTVILSRTSKPAGISNKNSIQKIRSLSSGRRRRYNLMEGLALIFLVIGVVYVGWGRSLTANWLVNLGAVDMARVELADFPTGKWDEGEKVTALASSIKLFTRALMIDPQNSTAHYRLGLIALRQREFSASVAHLEAAYSQNPSHRGVHKNLGYSYVWAGKYEKATQLLINLPEAKREMQVYAWWWGDRGREDLASHAEKMAGILENIGN